VLALSPEILYLAVAGALILFVRLDVELAVVNFFAAILLLSEEIPVVDGVFFKL